MFPYYLIFDTETTGLPSDRNVSPKVPGAWPHIVQLAWMTFDKQGKPVGGGNAIVKPDGYTIPEESTKVHGISHQQAMKEGHDINGVLIRFFNDLMKSNVIIAHNADFDSKVVASECYRLHVHNVLKHKKVLCTMKTTTNLCKIPPVDPKYSGFKWPKVEELYFFLFKRKPSVKMHNALHDVQVTSRCFFELLRRYPKLVFKSC
jgi:DNA polymerase III epsilon subunit-like protein